MDRNEKHAAFVKLHDGSDVLRLANVWDAASAKVVAHAGAKALATSSVAVATSLGFPDGNRLPRDMAVAAVARIAGAVDIPVTADMEEGFGDTPEAVAETIAQVAAAGAVGINIEDAVRDPAELKAKIEAIKARTKDTPIYVNARIDSYLRGVANPLQDSLRRAAIYEAAGADGIFVPGAVKIDEIRTLCEAIRRPVNVIVVPNLPSLAELKAAGVARLSSGGSLQRAALGITAKAAAAFLETGSAALMAENAFPADVFKAKLNS